MTHSRSSGHLQAIEKLTTTKRKISGAHQLDKQVSTHRQDAQVALRAIATTILTLAQTASTIRGHNEEHGNLMTWIRRRAEDIPQLHSFLNRKQSFVSRDIHNELLQLPATNVLGQVLTKVRQSPY